MISFKTISHFINSYYPKRGPLQQLDIDDKEILRLIEEFNAESASNSIKEYEF